MWNFVNILLFLCVGYGASVSDNDSSCCSNGYYLRNHNSRPICKHDENGNMSVSLDCADTMTVSYRNDFKFIVNEGGDLVLLLPNRHVVYKSGSFCDSKRDVLKNGETVREHMAVLCAPKTERVLDEKIVSYCMTISVGFLIFTVGLYIGRGHYRDLQEKSIINLCVSLAIGLGILVIMKTEPYSDMDLCATRGFLAYFFMLASFFWSNAVSIQILWSLRLQPGTKPAQEWKEFAGYAAYAWGVPTFLTIIMAVINFMPGDHLKPGIGLNHCWFFNVEQQWNYLYSVISVLLVVNIVLFVSATVFICCYGFPSQQETLRHKFATCLQLFIVMGIPWIFEMIGSLESPHLAWEITDLFNALQGVWIFFVLIVLQRKEKAEDNSNLYNVNITIEQPYNKLGKY